MIVHRVTYEDLVKYEPPLIRRGDPSSTYTDEYALFISKAVDILTSDIKAMGYKLKRLCTPLTVTTAKSDADYIERTRLILTVTAGSENDTIVLSGTNDESSETYTDVLTIVLNEDWTANYEATDIFNDVYKYYKLTASGGATFSNAYIVERAFELPIVYLSLHLIFMSKSKIGGDEYALKAEMYKGIYDELMRNNFFSYDKDEDGEVIESEGVTYSVEIHR